jgi:hypothetical protein
MAQLNRKEKRTKAALERLVERAAAKGTLDKVSQAKLEQLFSLEKLEKLEFKKDNAKEVVDATSQANEVNVGAGVAHQTS